MTSSEYVKYYESQVGGQYRVFRGGLQSGAGLGDVLRGLLRFLLPVALRGIGSFAGNMLTGTQAGLPLSAAAKAALTPAMTAAAGPAAARFISNVLPGIAGGVAATAKDSPASAPTTATAAAPQGVVAPQKGSGVLFDGVDGVPATDKAVKEYKREHSDGAPAVKRQRRTKSTCKKATQHKQRKQSTVHFNF